MTTELLGSIIAALYGLVLTLLGFIAVRTIRSVDELSRDMQALKVAQATHDAHKSDMKSDIDELKDTVANMRDSLGRAHSKLDLLLQRQGLSPSGGSAAGIPPIRERR
jgi:HAMP domain-containing protein